MNPIKIITLATLGFGLLALGSSAQAQVLTFDSIADFSGTPGFDGWSYGGVNFSGYSSFQSSTVAATFNPLGDGGNGEYDANVAQAVGGQNVTLVLTATTQDYVNGNAVDSERIWTATQALTNVSISYSLTSTVSDQIYAELVTANGTQTLLANDFVSTPSDAMITATVANMAAGDSIYFGLGQTGGAGDSSFTPQDVDMNITATAAPEPSSTALLALSFGAVGLVVYTRKARAI